jgi:polyisoprenoid-binding protein YceI
MKKIFCILAVIMAAPALAAPEEYSIDSRHTFPVFEVNHLGFSTQRGRFNKTSGKIVLDRAAKTGSVDLSIDVTSLDMGFDTWNQHMWAEGFFDVERYAVITFRSNKLVFDGDNVVAAEGDFTLLGVTRPVRLTVNNFKCGAHPMNKKEMCGADIATTIKRSDFGMKKSLPAVGDEVKIFSPVEAVKN